jgi:hypothetical protein
MIIDFTTGQSIEKDVQLLKSSDWEKFIKLLDTLVLQGYAMTVFNMTVKIVPRIGKVVTYFAELREK